MTTNNIGLLADILNVRGSGNAIRHETEVEVSSKFLAGTQENLVEVWYSPSGFQGSADDAKVIGFLVLPSIVAFNERENSHYKLACPSTSVWDEFKTDFARVIKMPQVSVEHQQVLFKHMFIK